VQEKVCEAKRAGKESGPAGVWVWLTCTASNVTNVMFHYTIAMKPVYFPNSCLLYFQYRRVM